MRIDFLELKQSTHRLYTKLFDPLLREYGLTQMEADILLFIANNPQFDTASQLVTIRRLTKSHVSTAVNHLAELGYLERFYEGDNLKTMHLRILPLAVPVAQAGLECQRQFKEILLNGISEEEKELLVSLLKRVLANTKNADQMCPEGENHGL